MSVFDSLWFVWLILHFSFSFFWLIPPTFLSKVNCHVVVVVVSEVPTVAGSL